MRNTEKILSPIVLQKESRYIPKKLLLQAYLENKCKYYFEHECKPIFLCRSGSRR